MGIILYSSEAGAGGFDTETNEIAFTLDLNSAPIAMGKSPGDECLPANIAWDPVAERIYIAFKSESANGMARFDSAGVFDATWIPGELHPPSTTSTINNISPTADGGAVYVGSNFTTLVPRVGRLGADGLPVVGFVPPDITRVGTPGSVNAVAYLPDSGNIAIAGSFDAADGDPVPSAILLDGTGALLGNLSGALICEHIVDNGDGTLFIAGRENFGAPAVITKIEPDNDPAPGWADPSLRADGFAVGPAGATLAGIVIAADLAQAVAYNSDGTVFATIAAPGGSWSVRGVAVVDELVYFYVTSTTSRLWAWDPVAGVINSFSGLSLEPSPGKHALALGPAAVPPANPCFWTDLTDNMAEDCDDGGG